MSGIGEVYTGFWWRKVRETDHLGDPGVDGRIILRCIYRKWDVGVWTGSIWLRPAASSMHYTTSCKHSLVLLRMGEIISRNMLS